MVSLKPHVEAYCRKELIRLGFNAGEVDNMDINIQVAICSEYGGGDKRKEEIMANYDLVKGRASQD